MDKISHHHEEAQSIADGPALLRKLAKGVGDKWFTDLCELVIAQPGSEFHEKLVADLFLSFNEEATIGHWLKAAAPSEPSATGHASSAGTKICFDRLGPFGNFRKLDGTLILEPKRNFTLVFGTNGSGKSSVCLALRCLAREDQPDTLLRNVKQSSAKHSFKFRLSQSGTDEEWTESKGYGVYVNEIAYFDGKVAHALVDNPAKAEQAIEVAPFGLEVFTHSGLLLTELDHECARQLEKLSKDELVKFQKVREAYSDIAFLADSKESSEQDRWLRKQVGTKIEWDMASDLDKLEEAEKVFKSLEESLTPGRAGQLKTLLRTTTAARRLVCEQVKRLRKLSNIHEKSITEKRIADTATRNGLLQSVLTSGEAEEAFLRLLQEANKVKELSADNEHCPLCKQSLDNDAASLFGKYKSILADAIFSEIEVVDKKLKKYKIGRDQILAKLDGWGADDLEHCLEAEDIKTANEITARICQSIGVAEGEFEPTDQFMADVKQVRILALHLRQDQRKLKVYLAELVKSEDELHGKIKGQKDIVRNLKIKKIRFDADAELEEYGNASKKTAALEKKRKNAGWQDKRTKLTQGLKQANDSLVRSEFEKALNTEYYRITDGLGMNHFGVSISIEAAKQNINLTAKVSGDHKISSVLSEGEQRLHAISLFFAEARIRKPHVLVFDDPSTSFDYGYADGVADRLSEYADDNPETQILVFTHNWEFFAKLDESLRKMEGRRKAGGLEFERHSLVVERCEEIKVRDTRLKEQRHAIKNALAGLPANATESQVRSVCADIRAWIEGVINHFVFNDQRQSYKTRHSSTLDMTAFMRVRPLAKEYADKLAKAVEKTSGKIHNQGGSGQLVLPTPAQLKSIFDDVDDVHNKLKADRASDPAF